MFYESEQNNKYKIALLLISITIHTRTSPLPLQHTKYMYLPVGVDVIKLSRFCWQLFANIISNEDVLQYLDTIRCSQVTVKDYSLQGTSTVAGPAVSSQ